MPRHLSQEEISLILENADKPILEISKIVGRTKQTVVATLRKHGHPPRSERVPFSADEDAYISENYRILGPRRISEILNRSETGVVLRAKKIGCCRIKKSPQTSPRTPAERKAAQKARRESQGLVRYAVWIPDTPEAKEAIRKAAEKLQG